MVIDVGLSLEIFSKGTWKRCTGNMQCYSVLSQMKKETKWKVLDSDNKEIECNVLIFLM